MEGKTELEYLNVVLSPQLDPHALRSVPVHSEVISLYLPWLMTNYSKLF